MLNWIKFFVLTPTFLFVSFGFGQSIWTNPITGTNPNTDNPYTTGDVFDANISVSGIGRGSGIIGVNSNNRYNARVWDTEEIDLSAYFEWTLTPNPGCEINFTSFVYTGQVSEEGPNEFAFRSSVDGFVDDIPGNMPQNEETVTETINLSAADYQNISGPITFRFYGWDTEDGNGTFSINNFTFNGEASCGVTLNTGAVTGGPFTVDCATDDAGNVAYTGTGTFNPGNTFTVQMSNASGSFASPTVVGSIASTSLSGSIPITIPAGTPSGTGYRFRVVSSNPALTAGDNGVNISITNGVCPNTINTGAITGVPFAVDCSTSDTGTIDFTSIGTFLGGNIYTAQLSNSTGSFAAPISIGTLTSTANSGTINITIPAGTATGAGYLIRIISSSPTVTGSSSASFTITLSGGPCVLTPPYMTSLIINSCNSTCSEGNNEVAFFNTGDYSVLMNSTNFELTYGSDPSPTTNYTDPLVSNSGTTDDLNIAAGCPGLFVDATNTTVPPNSSIMLASDEICPGDVLDFGNLCGSGPIYVVYSQDPSWDLTGNFVNDSGCSGGVRYLTTTITSTDGTTHVIDYSFDCTLNTEADGDYATWNFLGGEAIEQGNNGCTLEPVVLPITLIGFSGYYNGHSTDIAWQTLSEQNNDYFALYHSTNGKTFDRIGTVPGSGNTSTLLDYSFKHRTPHPGINYYKLKSVDYDGTVHDKGIIAVQVEMNHVFYDQITQSIQMNYSSDYAVYGSDGRLITRVANQNAIPFSGHGVFHVIDERFGKAFKLGVW